jgi:energy-coupling factor transport system ATP-binding protein
LIEFKDVYYNYDKDTSVLTNINLKIEQSEIIAIIGENGAGKTTLIRHINGLLKPTKGEIEIFGNNTKKSSVAKMSKEVGIVFQNSNNQIFADTVENEIKFGLDNLIEND